MRAAGVEPTVDAASLAVVGLVEVLSHLPRIHGEYRKLLAKADAEKPGLAILTDSPDFHLRVAKQLKKRGIPVIYLIAPQVWAWRKDRLPLMRRVIDHLLVIFPFEEAFFRSHGIPTTYIGHPLTHLAKPKLSRDAFFDRHHIPKHQPLVALCPGSRPGEVARHLPAVFDAAHRISQTLPASFLWAVPRGFRFFGERNSSPAIQVIEGETWDVLAHADLVLAASGTVTVETALLGTPMVTFYRVTALSWLLGKLLVRVPFYSMVNLIAGRRVVPELMQNEMTGQRIAEEAVRLLQDPGARDRMRLEFKEMSVKLGASPNGLPSDMDPIGLAARVVREFIDEQRR